MHHQRTLGLGGILLALLIYLTFPGSSGIPGSGLTIIPDTQQVLTPPRADDLLPRLSSSVIEQLQLGKAYEDGYEIIISHSDINADGHKESLLGYRFRADIFESDQPAEYFVRDFLILQHTPNRSNSPDTLLHASSSSITDHTGSVIMEIESAAGYQLILRTLKDRDHYSKDVQIIQITLINGDRESVSDELTIYWDPVANSFKTTNMFGAPGTFQ